MSVEASFPFRISSPRWFLKGEGTANDFVVMADLAGGSEPGPGFVRAVCDRRRGVGADGLLRIVPPPKGADPRARYFMDYRNADGSIAEMCGNGARVFATALRRTGLVTETDFHILTRGGLRRIIMLAGGSVSVAMGQPAFADGAELSCGLSPAGGRAVWMPNPHAVFGVADEAVLDGLDLTSPPGVEPVAVFPEGVNVEFVTAVADHHIRMRVHERGVGETRSCGTGAAAAAVASALACGEGPGAMPWQVDVPGGTLIVDWGVDELYLTGPAQIVAGGELCEEWEIANG